MKNTRDVLMATTVYHRLMRSSSHALGSQLCLGVHHLHEEKKVLHRDIKPNNVFLMDSKKIVQLGDFGLAKVLNDDDKQVKAEVSPPILLARPPAQVLRVGAPQARPDAEEQRAPQINHPIFV